MPPYVSQQFTEMKDIKIYKCDNSLTAKESSQNLHCAKYRHVKRFGETDDTL